MKRLWKFSLGRNSEFEADAFEKNFLTIGFGLRGDISHVNDRSIRELVSSLSADADLGKHDGDGDADELDVIPGGKRSSYSDRQLLILELQPEIRSYYEARSAILREMSGNPDMGNPAYD